MNSISWFRKALGWWAVPAVLILLALGSAPVRAVERGAGITGQIQRSQTDFLFPIWVSPALCIEPSVGGTHIEDLGSDLHFGLGLRGALGGDRDLVPYLGVRAYVLLLSPKSGDTVTDLVVGPVGGGEYFFGSHFSARVELQLNVTLPDEASNRLASGDRTVINSATAVALTVYF
jgi:hypothetical protein